MLARFLRSIDKKFKNFLRTKLLPGLDFILFFQNRQDKGQQIRFAWREKKQARKAGMQAGKL
jgi:hypothetical protein